MGDWWPARRGLSGYRANLDASTVDSLNGLIGAVI